VEVSDRAVGLYIFGGKKGRDKCDCTVLVLCNFSFCIHCPAYIQDCKLFSTMFSINITTWHGLCFGA